MNSLNNFLKSKSAKICALIAAVILVICILSLAIPSGRNAEFRSPWPVESEAFLGRSRDEGKLSMSDIVDAAVRACIFSKEDLLSAKKSL